MVEDLSWEGNSKNMYEKLVSAAPAFMRKKAENDFKQWIDKKGITTMTEDLLEEHIKETGRIPGVELIECSSEILRIVTARKILNILPRFFSSILQRIQPGICSVCPRVTALDPLYFRVPAVKIGFYTGA